MYRLRSWLPCLRTARASTIIIFTAGPKERDDRSLRGYLLLDFSDGAHRRALVLTSERADSLLVTTDEVLTEYLTFFAKAPESMRRKAITNAQRILKNPGVHVIPQSRASFLSGMAFYGARPDKGYSLTDCISMQTMRREGL